MCRHVGHGGEGTSRNVGVKGGGHARVKHSGGGDLGSLRSKLQWDVGQISVGHGWDRVVSAEAGFCTVTSLLRAVVVKRPWRTEGHVAKVTIKHATCVCLAIRCGGAGVGSVGPSPCF